MPKISKLMSNEARSNDAEVAPLQSSERNAVAVRVFSIFEQKRQMRDRSQDLFRDRTLKDYIDDNVKRFIQFKRRPAHKKKWQSNLASTTPYEKLMGVLSKLATQGMEAKVVSTEEISQVELMRERILNSLGKAAAIKNDDDFQLILEMLEANEKGTVIGFEDWFHGKRQIREITDQDPETGELKFKSKTIKEWNDVRGSLVNLEDFYPGDIYVRPGQIQDMDDCFLRTVMLEDEFNATFGGYEDADLVKTRASAGNNESTPFWRQSKDVRDDEVEVLRYFNKRTDEMVILANEIWINPIGSDTVSPLPWNHKKLPFWAAVYAPFDANFFYGRSLIDLLIAFVDAKDGTFDRIMDQMTLSVSRPVITDGNTASAMSKGFLQPSNVITADFTGGKPNFEILPIPEPTGSSIALYNILQDNLERTTISSEVIGGESAKKKTATETAIQAEGADTLVSLQLTLMEHGIKNKYRLRYPNMLQFYTLPSNSKEKDKRFRKIVLRNQKLANGKTGTLQIDINAEPNQQRVVQKDRSLTEPTEFLEITPESIRNFEFDVEIVPQSSIKMTEIQRQILELNYQKVMAELYPDMFDREQGFEDLNLKFGKDPQKARVQQPQQQQDPLAALQGGGTAQTLPGVGGLPPVRQNGLQAVNDLATV